MKSYGNHILIVCSHVDDMLITGSQLWMIQKFKDEMQNMFEMIDLGMMKFFLEMEVLQNMFGIVS